LLLGSERAEVVAFAAPEIVDEAGFFPPVVAVAKPAS
jgi:hypothetical protein